MAPPQRPLESYQGDGGARGSGDARDSGGARSSAWAPKPSLGAQVGLAQVARCGLAKRVIMLSGTPILNKAGDVAHAMSLIDPEVNTKAFVERYWREDGHAKEEWQAQFGKSFSLNADLGEWLATPPR